MAALLEWFRGSNKDTPKQTRAVTFPDNLEPEIVRVLCMWGDLSLTNLNEVLRQERWTGLSDRVLRQFLTTSSPHNVKLFCLEENSMQNECTVRVKTDAVLCKSYDARQDTCKEGSDCESFHICRHFVSGKCKKGRKCIWPHQLRSPHNDAILFEKGLQPVDDEYILQILQQSFETTAPAVRDHHDDFDLKRSPASKSNQAEFHVVLGHCLHPEQYIGLRSGVNEINEAICKYNLRGKCRFGNRCPRLHSDQHYQWQYLSSVNGTWTNFDQNVAIEEYYCNGTEDSLVLDPRNLCFKTMKWFSQDIRRLEIPPAKSKSMSNSWQSVLVTEWQWYFLDDAHIWVQYTNTAEVEQAYQKFQSTGQDSTFEFEIQFNRYVLDFRRMRQESKRYSTMRQVRRRPKFVSKDTRQRSLQKVKGLGRIFPKTWDARLAPADPNSNFVRCRLDPKHQDFKMVSGHFAVEMDANSIVTIERVQNLKLWHEFTVRRDHMQLDGQGESSKPLKLFHGTEKHVIEAICQQNFDHRVSGSRVGTIYGQGSYFSKSAKYSDDYASPDSNGLGHMFLVRVLVGSYTLGNPKYRRPPLKDPNNLFDSCVDNCQDPKIFVIFERNQVYPEYLITYKK